MTEYVAFLGYRHEVIRAKADKVFLIQSPAPRYTARKRYEVSEAELANLESWEDFKARTTKKVDRGTCQICERSIGNATGVIAHHGYRRPGYGWQTGSCPGARHESFEAGRDRLGWYIERLKERRDYMIDNLVKLDRREIDVLSYEVSIGPSYKGVKETRHARLDTDPVKYEDLRSRRLKAWAREIEALASSITYQTGRYDSWKAQ